MPTIYDFQANSISGAPVPLNSFKGKVVLIVNTASQCGFTPQYGELEAVYRKYKDQGFIVLGFPCNQFGAQEPGTESEIASFCETTFNVTFPMFQKVEVNGPGTHPLFDYLKSNQPGFLGSEVIKWNFTKFLVGKNGQVVERFAPTTSPLEIAPAIERELMKNASEVSFEQMR